MLLITAISLVIAFSQSVECFVIEPQEVPNDLTESILSETTHREELQIIFPGTKWCGQGNISSNNEDLGPLKKTDACCREHDRCDDFMDPGATKHNLTNKYPYSRLHCKCDIKLHECLKKNDNTVSNFVGDLYFDILPGAQCYQEEYPIVGCKTFQQGWLWKRCIDYKLDETKEKEWQWFDIPLYRERPSFG